MRLIGLQVFAFLFCSFLLVNCQIVSNQSRYVEHFRGTEAYELAKAVGNGNIVEIERIVEKDSTLLVVPNPEYGSNALVLAINVEQYEAFKKLLELGANPNYVNPFTKYSVLIEAIRPFGSQFEWREDRRYAKLLLEYGADPNYKVEDEFANQKGRHVLATSPLIEASDLSLNMVKMLIEYGADIDERVGGEIPLAEAISSRKFDVIYYYIDSLNVDVHQAMKIRSKDSLYIQDYINKFVRGYKEGTDGYKKTQKLIKDLKTKGVDFENYNYKLK